MTVSKKSGLIFFVFLCSLVAAQSYFLVDSSGQSDKPTTSPHTEEAKCSLCHQGPYQAKESIDQTLCHRCHRPEEYRKKRYRHTMEKGCSSCHQNHRPKAEPLLRGDPIDVCAACHEAIVSERTHPLRVRDPNTGGELTCTSSCHDVHGTDFKFLCELEPGRELCVSCHEDLK